MCASSGSRREAARQQSGEGGGDRDGVRNAQMMAGHTHGAHHMTGGGAKQESDKPAILRRVTPARELGCRGQQWTVVIPTAG